MRREVGTPARGSGPKPMTARTTAAMTGVGTVAAVLGRIAVAAGIVTFAVACANPVAELVREDVVVAKAGGRPEVVERSPAAGATSVAGNQPVSVVFDDELDAATVTSESVTVTSGGDEVPGTVTYNEASSTITFTPEDDYPRASTVTVGLAETIRNIGGASLGGEVIWEFETSFLNDYEIQVTIEPSADVITETQPLYVVAADVSDRTTGFQTATDVHQLTSLTELSTFYLDLRTGDPAGDYWLALHHDRDNSVADGSDDLAYNPDVLVGGYLGSGYNGLAMNMVDPDDRLAIHVRGGAESTVSEATMEVVFMVDRRTRNPNAGIYGNPDFIVRGGDSVTLRLYREQDVSPGSPDVIELAVEDNVPTLVEVNQYGTHWFRFTPTASFVPAWVDVDRPSGGDTDAFVKAWLYDDNPVTGSPTEEWEFYSLNEAQTDFGFWDASAELNQALTAGVEYYLQIVVVHLERQDGLLPVEGTVAITFYN